ncbi:MAG: CvpA family protein [Gemmataceae bacterium]
MLATITLLIMAGVAYAHWREGIFTGFCTMVNILLSGIIAFNFWEPLATAMEPGFTDSFGQGYEDLFCLIFLFCVSFGLFRYGVDKMTPDLIDHYPLVQQFGGAVFGLISGYLISGFLVVVLQTLPWHENFMGFQPRDRTESSQRSVFPSDRVWLAMMRRAGAYTFAGSYYPKLPKLVHESRRGSEIRVNSLYEHYRTFDRQASFEIRYRRYRRYNDERGPIPYLGEFEDELKFKSQ